MKIPIPVLIAMALTTPFAGRANTIINTPTNSPNEQRLGGIVTDWFPDPQHQSVCYAQYTPPEFDTPNLGASFSEQTTTIKADSGNLLNKGSSALEGNILISQPNRKLYAERLHLYKDQNGELITADVYNHVLLEEPDFRAVGDQAHIAFPTNDIQLNDAQFRNYAQHGRGSAAIISRHDKDPVIMKDVRYTTCPPGDNTWELRSKTLELDQQEEQGYAYHSWVYIKGIPVAYTPWISFPLSNKRKSGLLKPTLGQSDRSGNEFRIPYYWNAAPNLDMTITPLMQSKRGLHLHTEERYLWQNGNGVLLAELQPHDSEFARFRNFSILTNPEQLSPDDPRFKNLESAGTTRTAIGWANSWQIAKQWNLESNYQWASDDNYFVDLDSDIGAQNFRNLRRYAELQYHGENLSLRSEVESYQVLQPYQAVISAPPYRLLPEIDANYTAPPLIENVEMELPVNFTQYEHEGDPITLEKPPTGKRYDVGPSLRYEYRTPSGFIAPHVRLRHTEYDIENNQNKAAHPTRTLPISSLDTGLFFERDTSWFKQDFLQTLEPRLFYLYTPFADQSDIPTFDSGLTTFSFEQLFQDNRFSGHDRIGDANQLSYSALSRWLAADDGNEKARVSMGQILYFQNRRVTTCDNVLTPSCILTEDPDANESLSDFVGEGVYHLSPKWNVIGDVYWDSRDNRLSRYSARIEWQQSVDRLVNFRYNAIREVGTPDQISTDTSFVWRFNPRWRIVSRWNYDWTKQLVIDEFGGIEYENCCWAIRTGARGTLNLNNGHHQSKDQHFFVQWFFKGLTSFGEGFAEQKGLLIPGYRDNFATTY